MNSFSAQKARQDTDSSSRWSLSEIAGRLVEISGSRARSSLTLAAGLVLEAQHQGELAGWATSRESFFYPPDIAAKGIDLNSLMVVCVPDACAIPRAGEKLLRSGAFGAVVLDLGSIQIPMPLQARLSGLARKHYTALICLTEKDSSEPSLSSLVSLRVHSQRAQSSCGKFACSLRVLKDKRRGPTWKHSEVCSGPQSVCKLATS